MRDILGSDVVIGSMAGWRRIAGILMEQARTAPTATTVVALHGAMCRGLVNEDEMMSVLAGAVLDSSFRRDVHENAPDCVPSLLSAKSVVDLVAVLTTVGR